ncbi:MAG TPA: isoamylase early set domain-containing protein [Longimicrobiales bacterium]
MKDRLHQYLDGELPLDDLDPEERLEAEDLRELLADAAALRAISAPPWIETRVMASLPDQPHRSRLGQLLSWVTLPQAVRVRPLSLGLAGVAAALLLFFARTSQQTGPVILEGPAISTVRPVVATQPSIIYVQFVLADRGARSVTVAGDFNDWDVGSTPLIDADGDGVWTGLVALRPGQHKYMFVIDGKRWVTDPEAERYIDDGFGMRNAVVTVTPPNGRTI